MFDRFTDRGRKVMGLAKAHAVRMNHESIAPEHILLGLLQEGSGVAVNVLMNLDQDLRLIRSAVEKLVDPGPQQRQPTNLPFTPRAKKVLELAVEEASSLGHNYIGTEHLLLGVLKEEKSIAARALAELGVELEKTRDEVLEFLGADDREDQESGGEVGTGPARMRRLSRLWSDAQNLSARAERGQLGPFVARDSLLDRMIRVLLRRTGANPILLGASGVGKTSLVHALATRIEDGDVPHALMGRRIVSFDLINLMARSWSSDSLDAICREARDRNLLLVLDDLTTSVAAPLHRLLAEGISCIGLTTEEHWRSLCAGDPALERQLQPILVKPATREETLQMLGAWRRTFETAHAVQITDGALAAASKLADLHLPDRPLPATAFDVLDDAAARVVADVNRSPQIRRLSAEIRALDLEKEELVVAREIEKAAAIARRADTLREERRVCLTVRQSAPRNGHGTVAVEQIRETIAELSGKHPSEIDGDL